MTGRELIMYILRNELEDVDIFKDGRVGLFWNMDQAAVHFNVGRATVKAWIELGQLDYIRIGDELYIPIGTERKTI